MEIIGFVIVLLVIIILALVFLLFTHKRELQELKKVHEELMFDHRSKIVKHGKSFEQLFPFMSNYPYNPNNFRFLGSPVDGISFEDDDIVFIEFKTGSSQLNENQKRVKDLVNNKKVKWKEIRDR